jgi:ABC-type nitrate/sulfonate/bicarbonate transport system permease component
MSEFISGTNYSLGYSLKDSYQNNIEMVYVYAWTLILIIISLIITKICDFLQEKK